MKRVILFLITTMLFSCVSQREVMDSYLGKHKSQVIGSFGPYQGLQSDGNGGEILIYSQVRYYPPPPNTYMAGQNIQYSKYFYVNPSGYVYYWRTDKRQVAPGQMEVIIR